MAKDDKWYEPGGWGSRILDPGGIFHEEGFLGWDLFGLDNSSEQEMEDKMNALSEQQKASLLKKKIALYKMERYLKIIFIVFIIYMVSKMFK